MCHKNCFAYNIDVQNMVGSNKYLSYKCSRIKFYIFGYIKNMQTITYNPNINHGLYNIF